MSCQLSWLHIVDRQLPKLFWSCRQDKVKYLLPLACAISAGFKCKLKSFDPLHIKFL